MKKQHVILVVDDEEDILEFVSYNLSNSGYKVLTANNGLDAITIATEAVPDLVILDVMMPDMDGIVTCQEMRSRPELTNTIITFLTARSEDYSQIAGLEAGADDYITKPIRPKVLLSRVKALLRRLNSKLENNDILEVGDVIVNRDKHVVIFRGVEVFLAKKEFQLLVLLMSKPGKVFNRDEILNKVWGSDVVVGDRTIDVHVRKIREKTSAEYIKTVKGVGYRFEN